jgi:uncharacterized membrane protein YbhN (UPF0104 family)
LSKSVKNIIQYAIILGIGGVFLFYVFNGIDWSDQLQRIKSANPYWLTLGMSISLLSHWFRAYRATMLYDALNYKISTKNSIYAVNKYHIWPHHQNAVHLHGTVWCQ